MLRYDGEKLLIYKQGDSDFSMPYVTATDNVDGSIARIVEQLTINLDITKDGSTLGSETIDVNEEGIYILTYQAEDTSGNFSEILEIKICIDGTAPVFTDDVSDADDVMRVQQNDSSFTMPTVTVADNMDGSEYGNGVEYELTITKYDSDDNQVDFSGTEVDVTAEGKYVLEYVSSDEVGNEGRTTITVVVDGTAPVLTNNYASGELEFNVNGSAEFVMPLINDDGTDIALSDNFEEFYPDMEIVLEIEFDGVSKEYADVVSDGKLNLSVDGTYTLTYYATDGVGNESERIVLTVIVDGTPPVFWYDTDKDKDSDEHDKTDIRLKQGDPFSMPTVTATDAKNGDMPVELVVTYEYGTEVAPEDPLEEVDPSYEGVYTLTYSTADLAGNTTSMTVKVTVDGTAPVLAYDTDGDSDSDFDDLILKVQQGTGKTEHGTTFAMPTVTATDNLDPDTDLNSKIELSVTKEGAGVRDTVNINDPGSYLLEYTLMDHVRNTTSVIITVIVDGDPPVLTYQGETEFNIDVGDVFNIPVVPEITAEDFVDGNLNDRINLKITNPSVIEEGLIDTTAKTLDTSNPGSYVLTYTSTDDVGNVSDPVEIIVNVGSEVPKFSYTINGVDSTDVINTEERMVVKQNTPFADPAITAHDAEDGYIDIVQNIYKSDKTGILGTTVSAIETAEEAIFKIIYSAEDKAGNVSTMSVVVLVDGTPPAVEYTGQDLIKVQQNTGKTTDGSTFIMPDVTGLDTHLDDETEVATVTLAIKRDPIFLEGVSDVDITVVGTYTLTYTLTDGVGNSTEKVIVVIVDGEAPVLTYEGGLEYNVDLNDDLKTILDGDKSIADLLENVTAFDNIEKDMGIVTPSIVQVEGTGFPSNGGIADITANVGKYELTFKIADAVFNESKIIVVTINVGNNVPLFSYNIDGNEQTDVVTTTETMYVKQDSVFVEPMVSAEDAEDGFLEVTLLTYKVVSGVETQVESVDTLNEGTFKLVYSATDKADNRSTMSVIVLVDGGKPVITPSTTETLFKVNEHVAFDLPTITATDEVWNEIESANVPTEVTTSMTITKNGEEVNPYLISEIVPLWRVRGFLDRV